MNLPTSRGVKSYSDGGGYDVVGANRLGRSYLIEPLRVWMSRMNLHLNILNIVIWGRIYLQPSGTLDTV